VCSTLLGARSAVAPPKLVCFSVLSCISLGAKFGGFNVRFLMFYFIKAACILDA
jgi:hypothetical protein